MGERWKMTEWLKRLRGYVKIRVWGFAPQRFINLCSNKGILLWNIEKQDDVYIMCVSLESFYRLRSIARKTKVRVVISERYGLPFFCRICNGEKHSWPDWCWRSCFGSFLQCLYGISKYPAIVSSRMTWYFNSWNRKEYRWECEKVSWISENWKSRSAGSSHRSHGLPEGWWAPDYCWS